MAHTWSSPGASCKLRLHTATIKKPSNPVYWLLSAGVPSDRIREVVSLLRAPALQARQRQQDLGIPGHGGRACQVLRGRQQGFVMPGGRQEGLGMPGDGRRACQVLRGTPG